MNIVLQIGLRLRGANPVIAGALCVGLLAFNPAFAQQTIQTGNDTAALTPEWGEETNQADTLPTPLSIADAVKYREIFRLQEDGHWKDAGKLIAKLKDDLLLGHVQHQRYMHPTKYRSTYKELKTWMGRFADHPDAKRVYSLAIKRRPANYKYPMKPRSALPAELAFETDASTVQKKQSKLKKPYRSRAQRNEIRQVQRQIRRWVQRGTVTASLDLLTSKRNNKIFDQVSRAESLGIIARGYFRYHKDREAVAVALDAIKLIGGEAENAAWWGGLAAYRLKDYKTAAALFEAMAEATYISDWSRSAAAFWASRTHLVGGTPQHVSKWLKMAAAEPRSFYGLLAIRSLGAQPNFDWELPQLTQSQTRLLDRIPAARRAMALVQVGQSARAEAELQRIAHVLPLDLAQILLAAADAGGLADLAYRIGALLERKHGMRLDAAIYPMPHWQPEDGFKVDRSLIYAFIRQESRFRPNAKSKAGASGVMQLMPATAGYMAGKRLRGNDRQKLFDPAYNMSLGQKYIRHLLEDSNIGGNLFYTLAAYNAGPGNLQKWRSKVDYNGDPLLFIESLPSRETRLYMEHVLSNLWIYRTRMGQPAPTLDALLAGNWPVYIALDEDDSGLRLASGN